MRSVTGAVDSVAGAAKLPRPCFSEDAMRCASLEGVVESLSRNLPLSTFLSLCAPLLERNPLPEPASKSTRCLLSTSLNCATLLRGRTSHDSFFSSL